MPDLLARDVSESDKSFISSYARQHGLSQAEVLRQIFRIGVSELRRVETTEDAEWDQLAGSLTALREDDFEATAWG